MLKNYFGVAFDGAKPALGCAIASVMYVMFPEKSFLTACLAVLATVCLDIITKYYSIASCNGGLKKCFQTRAISSEIFFYGTSRKLFSYLVIFILTGLSYRVAPAQDVSILGATIVYSILFLRECQSILENLSDAGCDVGLLLIFVKRKQDDLVDKYVKKDEEDPK